MYTMFREEALLQQGETEPLDNLVCVSPPGERLLMRTIGLFICLFTLWILLASVDHEVALVGTLVEENAGELKSFGLGGATAASGGSAGILLRVAVEPGEQQFLHQGTEVLLNDLHGLSPAVRTGRLVAIKPEKAPATDGSSSYTLLISLADQPSATVAGELLSIRLPAGKRRLIAFFSDLLP